MLALEPGQVFSKLGKAHESLLSALTDPKANLANALEAIQAFAVEANEALAIANDLREAIDKAGAANDDK